MDIRLQIAWTNEDVVHFFRSGLTLGPLSEAVRKLVVISLPTPSVLLTAAEGGGLDIDRVSQAGDLIEGAQTTGMAACLAAVAAESSISRAILDQFSSTPGDEADLARCRLFPSEVNVDGRGPADVLVSRLLAQTEGFWRSDERDRALERLSLVEVHLDGCGNRLRGWTSDAYVALGYEDRALLLARRFESPWLTANLLRRSRGETVVEVAARLLLSFAERMDVAGRGSPAHLQAAREFCESILPERDLPYRGWGLWNDSRFSAMAQALRARLPSVDEIISCPDEGKSVRRGAAAAIAPVVRLGGSIGQAKAYADLKIFDRRKNALQWVASLASVGRWTKMVPATKDNPSVAREFASACLAWGQVLGVLDEVWQDWDPSIQYVVANHLFERTAMQVLPGSRWWGWTTRPQFRGSHTPSF